MLAALTQTPELALSDEESRKLASALADATKGMSLPALTPQRMAFAVLIWTAATIYGPRVAMISQRRSGKAPAAVVQPNGGEAFVRPDPGIDAPEPWVTFDRTRG